MIRPLEKRASGNKQKPDTNRSRLQARKGLRKWSGRPRHRYDIIEAAILSPGVVRNPSKVPRISVSSLGTRLDSDRWTRRSSTLRLCGVNLKSS